DRLSTLSDPPVPDDFTVEVLDAVDHRERALQQRRHTVLAAIPAGLIGLFAIFGWALSVAPTAHVDRFLEAWTLARPVLAAATPAAPERRGRCSSSARTRTPIRTPTTRMRTRMPSCR